MTLHEDAMRTRRIWLTVLALACAGAATGCATSDGQGGGDRAPRGVYVGGAGGYGIH